MQTTEFILKDADLPFLRIEGSATAKVGDLIPLGGRHYRVVFRAVQMNGRSRMTTLTVVERLG